MDHATAIIGNASNNNNKRPTPYDYAALHEHWLVHQHQTQTQSQNASKNNNLAYASALAARAGRLGTIQCAMRDQQQQQQHPGNPAFLQAMLERMQMDGDDGVPLALPDYVTQAAPFNHSNSKCPQVNNVVDVDVDAFFDEYPECIRPGWNIIDESDDDDDSDDHSDENEHDDLAEQARRKKRPLSTKTTQPARLPAQPQQQQQQQQPSTEETNRSTSCILYSQNSYTGGPSQPAPPQQPQQRAPSMAQRHNQHHHEQQTRQSQMQPPQPLPPPANNNLPNNTQCWDDHVQAQNPFQTAREYAKASSNSSNSNNSNVHRSQQNQQQQNSWNNNHNNNIRNPYQQHNQQQQRPPEEEPTSPMVQAPVIRDSLKRKFQPPKRGAVRRETTSSSNSSTSNASQKKSSRDKDPKTNNNNNNKGGNGTNSEDDDDDLPEELKRYGKKLVEQIQNEIMSKGDDVTFDDIAGLDDAKETIQEIVCWPMKRPDLFTGLRRTPNGLLLFGPPGTGKTLIGKAIAHESGACFFSISSSSLTSKWVGEGEKLVRTLFAVAAFNEPAVVFIDEIDSLLTQRKSDDNEASRRIKTEFLVQLDGTGTSGQGRVLVIGATNRPQELDEAARRRFVKRLYIPLPNESDRACLLRVLLTKNEHTLTPQDVDKLAAETKGFSGADLKSLSADAAMGPIRQLGVKALETKVEDIPPISFKHFRQSLRGMHPSVSPEDIVQYEVFDKTYGSKRASATPDDDDDDEDPDN